MSPNEWVEKHFEGEFFSGNFDHLKSLIKKLGIYPSNSKIITIAGTNGKGQTTRILAKLFFEKNITCLTLTSPHLLKINERFHFNDSDIDDERLLLAFEYIDQRTGQENLSYFEFLYLVYLYLAKILKPSIILQEVGLGGRLDATNAIDADISVVTSISRDHQQILGNKLREILIEKLGIARSSGKLITCLELEYLRGQTARYCNLHKIIWTDLFDSGVVQKKSTFSARNLELAKQVFKMAQGFEYGGIEILDTFEIRGKLSRDGASWDLFPTHNVDGLRKLVHFLEEEQYNNYDLVLFAPSRRLYQDLEVMSKILRKCFSSSNIFLVHFEHLKALGLSDLDKLSTQFGFTIVKDIKKFKCPSSTSSVLVLGSNYFLGTLKS